MHDDIAFELDQVPDEPWPVEESQLVTTRGNRGSIFSVRFGKGEIGELKRFAEAQGMTTGEFIRNAALAAMAGRELTPEELFAALKDLAARTGTAIMLVPRPQAGEAEKIA